MMGMTKFTGLAAAAALAAGLAATSAGAVTVVENNGSYDVPGDGTQFIGDVMPASGGAGAYKVTFNLSNAGSASALVTIGPLVASSFSDLLMSWVGSDDSVIASTGVTPISTTLGTMFVDPESLSQSLVFSWSDSLKNVGFDFEVEVSPIPVPAAGLLLLTGIAGLGAIRSRRKASVEA